jgi:hypothetical protein
MSRGYSGTRRKVTDYQGALATKFEGAGIVTGPFNRRKVVLRFQFN